MEGFYKQKEGGARRKRDCVWLGHPPLEEGETGAFSSRRLPLQCFTISDLTVAKVTFSGRG